MPLYWLYEIPLWLNFVVFVLVLWASMEAGRWFGLRRHRESPELERATRGDVTLGSMLALLGLMLAFTYSFSMSRADQRKKAVVDEANAIGTAFLRADLLAEPGRTELRKTMLDYARTRLVTAEMARNRAQLNDVVARSIKAQSALWPATKAAIVGDASMPAPLKASLVQAVNEVIDAHGRRLAASNDRLPAAVFVLLIVIAAVSMAVASFNDGLSGRSDRWRMGSFVLVLAALIFLILDFDVILRGFVQVSSDSLVALIREMEAGVGDSGAR